MLTADQRPIFVFSSSATVLPSVLSGARTEVFETYRDMVEALKDRRVDAVLAYEWQLRFSISAAWPGMVAADARDLIMLPHAFMEKYHAFRVSPKFEDRQAFNQALLRVVGGATHLCIQI
jgi:ABC-type amino acid transport substrate-binding protein